MRIEKIKLTIPEITGFNRSLQGIGGMTYDAIAMYKVAKVRKGFIEILKDAQQVAIQHKDNKEELNELMKIKHNVDVCIFNMEELEKWITQYSDFKPTSDFYISLIDFIEEETIEKTAEVEEVVE